MIGQGYEGAASMSKNFKRIQTVIGKGNSAALYMHCSEHS